MTALLALDLDQTLLFNVRADPSLRVLEHLDGIALSGMTQTSYELLTDLVRHYIVVPTTTRTVAQFQRIALPSTTWSLCANGGILLVDGAPDPEWDDQVRNDCSASAPLAAVQDRLAAVADEPWVKLVRTAEDLFCYVVAHTRDQVPAGWLAELTTWATNLGWSVSLQGRKIYLVPLGLSKGAAAQRLASLIGADLLVGAGDSLLDRSLLHAADLAVRPAHGELHDLGWAPPGLHVTTATGPAAGEELLGWLGAQLGGQPSWRST